MLESNAGRPALRFERELAYPIDRVWAAVSTPSELERWFPAATEWQPAAGETLEALLAGQPLSDNAVFADWDAVHEHYAAKFGVDPTPGREFWEHLKDSLDLETK